LNKKREATGELSPLQRVWLGVIFGCFVAMYFGIPPGVGFWALLGVALLFGSLLAVSVLELRNKPRR
jgi:Flp pilus assembly protein TadB